MGAKQHVQPLGGTVDPTSRLGQLKRCVHNGTEFVRVELDGRILLVPPACPHRGTPMTEAHVQGNFIVCGRHGATFDLRTGGWVRGPKCDNINIIILGEGSGT